MRAKQLIAPLMSLLLVASLATPVAASSAQTSAYAGSNVSFDVNGSAIADYTVNGDAVLDSVKVQSQSEAEASSGIDLGADLSSVASFAGAALSLDTEASTHATVASESGAALTVHDNSNGILVVESGGESQVVLANVSAYSNADAQSDGRVVVTSEDGTEGTFIVVGEGSATVNDDGNVTAELGEGSRLVFRAYSDGRSGDDEREERMIANGTAAGEVHVMQRSGETVADTVNYSSDTTVEVVQTSEGTVTLTAERAEHEGKVIITSVSEAVLDARDDLHVTVDGEAAVEASSYSDLEGAIGGDTSKYMVRQSSSASASADVLVAVNHFSEREVSMSETDSSSDDGSDDSNSDAGSGDSSSDGSTDSSDESDSVISDGQPGFGALVAIGAFAVLGMLGAVRRQ